MQAAEALLTRPGSRRATRAAEASTSHTHPHPQPWLQPLFLAAPPGRAKPYPIPLASADGGAAGPGARARELLANSSAPLEEAILGEQRRLDLGESHVPRGIPALWDSCPPATFVWGFVDCHCEIEAGSAMGVNFLPTARAEVRLEPCRGPPTLTL